MQTGFHLLLIPARLTSLPHQKEIHLPPTRARATKHDLKGVTVWYNVRTERDRWRAGDWQPAHEVTLVFSIEPVK
jgi:hypothetical protein